MVDSRGGRSDYRSPLTGFPLWRDTPNLWPLRVFAASPAYLAGLASCGLLHRATGATGDVTKWHLKWNLEGCPSRPAYCRCRDNRALVRFQESGHAAMQSWLPIGHDNDRAQVKVVGAPGFAPGINGPKPIVLLLHYAPKLDAAAGFEPAISTL